MGLGFAVCFVSLVACLIIFLVCDPKLILQISGTFQETCRKPHRKTEEADNAVKELLSKLSDCDELGKMDLDELKNMCSDMAALTEAVERQRISLTFFLPAMV